MADSELLLEKALLAQNSISMLHEYMTLCNDDLGEFMENNVYRDACVTQINNLSECIKYMDKKHGDVLTKYIPSVDMRGLIGMRCVAIHQYGIVDWNIIWVFLHEELPIFESGLSKLVSNEARMHNPSKKRRKLFHLPGLHSKKIGSRFR